MQARIALLPGDGVGPEVVDAAVLVLDAIGTTFGHTFTYDRAPVGGAALTSHGKALPAETLAAATSAQAILLGAVGDATFNHLPRAERPEAALLTLRQELGLFANLRPARMWPQLADTGPLRPELVRDTDMFIVRELTGGLYFGEPRGFAPDGASAFNTMRYSVEEVVRVAEVAFEAARKRRRKVTSVDKANVLETSELWRREVSRVGERYPDVELDHMYVDACAMSIAFEPKRFDVILTENLFGDVLSDEAGAIVGSLGLLPSASLGKGVGLFEPVHGTAPTIAGKDLANPIGAIGSASMLLRYGFDLTAEADAIDAAIAGALGDGCRTVDLVPRGSASIGCMAMAKAIAARI